MYDLQRYLGWSDQGLKDDVIYNLKFFVSCMETVLYLLIFCCVTEKSRFENMLRHSHLEFTLYTSVYVSVQ